MKVERRRNIKNGQSFFLPFKSTLSPFTVAIKIIEKINGYQGYGNGDKKEGIIVFIPKRINNAAMIPILNEVWLSG